MGKIYDAASLAWYDYLFAEVHKKEDEAKAKEDDKAVIACWGEYSAILKKEEKRKLQLFSKCERRDFSKERSMKVVYEDEKIVLRPYCDADENNFAKVKGYYTGLKTNTEYMQKIFKESAKDPDTFICVIEDSNTKAFMGYVDINDITRTVWELGIELLPEYCGKGFGEIATLAFLHAVKSFTGISEYRAFVEIDNYASQKFMRKIDAKLIGLFDLIFGDEEVAKQFEEQNTHLITPEIEELAKEMNIEPKQMLSKVLDYRISV